MSTQTFGQSIRRNEDACLLTGRALFVDDVQLLGMLHATFVRSDYAHARILSIDTSAAKAREGVLAVYTAEDLGDYWKPQPLIVPPPPVENLVFHERTHVPLAKDKVRFVGEPIAVVVAESRYIAEDAAADVMVEFEPLDVVTDMEKALEGGGDLVHADLESNMAAHLSQQKGDYEKAKKDADVVVRRRFYYDHGTAAPIETRCIVAAWDARQQRLTMWDTTQAPIPLRNGLAGILGLSQSQVQVIAPFVGGGFGSKLTIFYPEEVVLPWASMRLERPIKWTEDRAENFVATTHERDQLHDSEIALTRDGKILGVKDVFIHDTGAYNPYGLTVPINSQCTLLGCYDVPNYYTEFKAVFTNKTMIGPYRGAGRQHGVFVMERLLDLAAKELGLDVVEIRRRNLLQPDDFPVKHQIIYQDFTELGYDSGNYPECLKKAADLVGYEKFVKEEQPRLRKEGKHVGIGLVTYVEGTGIGPYEGACVTVETTGKVRVATGVGTQGQSHFTSFAQIVADQLGVEVSDVFVETGDTDQFRWGTGTFASRGAVVAGNACRAAAERVRGKVLAHGAEALQAPLDDLRLAEGYVHAPGGKKVSLAELAAAANPLRGAVKPGTEPGLEATEYFGPQRGTTANGVHAVILDIDPETMIFKILKYAVVHDCGNMINPTVVEGQVLGGVAQGLGNAFYEKLHYDENGQLLNASFMDFLLPTSLDMPHVDSDHVVTPSPSNPLGVKGCGEAGAIPVGPLICQAIENALGEARFEILECPLSPCKVFELFRAAREGTAAKPGNGES